MSRPSNSRPIGGPRQNNRNDISQQMSRMNISQKQQQNVDNSNNFYRTQIFAKRPEQGCYERLKNIGKQTEVLTNYAAVRLPEEPIKLYCYNVEVYRGNRHLTKREDAGPVFWKVIDENRRDLPRIEDMIFNDSNMLWTRKQLKSGHFMLTNRQRGSREQSIHFKYVQEVILGPHPATEQEISLTMTIVDAIATARVRNLSNHSNYFVFKRLTFLVTENPGDARLPVKLTIPIGSGTAARVGFTMAVKLNLRAGPMCCFNLGHSMFYRPDYPVIRLLAETANNAVMTDEQFEEEYDEQIRSCMPTQHTYDTVKQILKGARLCTQINDLRVSFKFADLGVPADQESFDWQEGDLPPRRVTVAEFFLLKHNIRLRYPNLPTVIRQVKKGIIPKYPMELCSFVSAPKRLKGSLPTIDRNDVASAVSYSPEHRKLILEHIVQQNSFGRTEPFIDNEDKWMQNNNVEFGKELLKTKAIIIPPPTLVYGNSTFEDSDHVGSWHIFGDDNVRTVLEDEKFVKVDDAMKEKVIVGSIITIESPFNKRHMEFDSSHYYLLMDALESCGQKVHRNEGGFAEILRTGRFNQALDPICLLNQMLQEIKETVENDDKYKSEKYCYVPLVLFICRTRCSFIQNDRIFNDYNVIKHIGDNIKGVYTQGILFNNFHKIKSDYKNCDITIGLVQKILGKIGTSFFKLERDGNHKNWTKFTDPEKPTLCLGIDVSHPSKAQRDAGGFDALSVSSVVGNIDIAMTQFRMSARLQESGQEIIVRMEDQVQSRIHDFIMHTGKRPAHIVVYRDGVGENDFQRVSYEERITIEESCLKISPDFQPTITYIVVAKRHDTKLFAIHKEDQLGEESFFNLRPGTVVEHDITDKRYFDFFMISQAGTKGTSSPAHYYVLHDTWAPSGAFWQTISYALAYNNCRSTKSGALPAPLHYAHLAAKRAKESLYAVGVQSCFDNEELVNTTECVLKTTTKINSHRDMNGMNFV